MADKRNDGEYNRNGKKYLGVMKKSIENIWSTVNHFINYFLNEERQNMAENKDL